MPIKTRELRTRLINKFHFTLDENRSVDHIWFKLQLPGMPVITTKVSHGNDGIGASLAAKIARQLGVDSRFLEGMIVCTKSKDDYEAWVRAHPMPPPKYIR